MEAEASGSREALRGLGLRIPVAWLASQRWFAGKARTLTGIALRDAAPLPGTSGEPDAFVLLEDVAYADGGVETYALPMVAEAEATTLRPPNDGDGVWRRLARLVHTGGEMRGSAGSFRFEPAERSPGAQEPAAEAATERTLGAEQSNTAVALDDVLFLKLYRRLEPGESPEVELARFLNEQARFRGTPRLHGSAHYVSADGRPWALAILQDLVAAEGSAWEFLVDRLRDVMARSGSPSFTLLRRDLAALGSVTGDLHRALASAPSEAFPVRPASADERERWVASARDQLGRAREAVRGRDRERLTDLEPAIVNAFEPLRDAARPATVSRIHGDYHLGQLLRVGRSFVVTDFEGEPARPLAERRRPHSPLKDVAGMLRSLDYAGLTAARRMGANDSGSLYAERWWTYAVGAFVEPYARSAGQVPDRALLRAFAVEKACYEVAYEAANRPEWLWLPILGLERLLATLAAG
ncbi:MAG: hypothetical protein ABR509_08160 [Candidatus Limnocylindria bacterium]